MTHRVYLMTDYGSSSLWTDEPSHGMVPLDALPLDEETKRALEAWSPAASDNHDGLSDPDGHRALGLRLWAAVRDQLGPDYEVGLATFVPTGRDGSDKVIVWRPEDIPPGATIG